MKLCRLSSFARLPLRSLPWLVLLFFFSLSGCRTASKIHESSDRVSGATALIGSTLSQHSQMLRQSDSNLTLSQTIECFALDSSTGRTYLQSRTTLNLSGQSSSTSASDDTLLVNSSAEVAIADSTRHINDVEVEANDSVTPSLTGLIAEIAIVMLSLAAACFIIVWYIKRK